jgi:hypothetical protein
MNTPLKLAGFGLGLVAVFGAAAGLGAVAGPDPADAAPAAHDMDDTADAGHTDDPGSHDAGVVDEVPAGLQVSEAGYTLALETAAAPAGTGTEVAFRVLGPDGAAVTDYALSHEEDLHLVAARRDLSGYQHVHPTLGADGVWRVPLDLTPGSWRLFADFAPAADGENRVLGADLAVPGTFDPAPLPAASATSQVDGYTVVLTGDLHAGSASELTLSVSRDGVPVTDLQPYLGAFGHLVVLRDGDLGYLHVHPGEEPGGAEPAPGPHVRFVAEIPSAGTYALFLDFRHGGAVHTAGFTVEAGS